MRTGCRVWIVCLVFSAIAVEVTMGHDERQTPGPEDAVHSSGSALDHPGTKERMLSLLKSNNAADREAAMDVLREGLALVMDDDGQLDPSVRNALSECYRRMPSFPTGTRIAGTNVVGITRNPKVFALWILVSCGGDEGRQILDAALRGDDLVMKEIAYKLKQLLSDPSLKPAKIRSGHVLDIPEESRARDVPLTDLTNRMATAFVGQSAANKRALLRDIRARRKELGAADSREVRKALVATLKQHLAAERAPSVLEDILATVVALEERQAAVSYLNAIIEDPVTSLFLKSHARYLRDAVEQDVFR